MTRGDLKWQLLGRPVKPVAFFISMTLFTVFWYNVVIDADLARGAIVGDVIGSMAFAALAALIGGWLARSQVMVEVGLIIAFFVWVTRSTMILYTFGPDHVAFWLSLCWAGVIAGAYVLESQTSLPRLTPE